jgi:hypothetical protein
MENRLSLEERVVGRERDTTTATLTSVNVRELTSPSSVLQSRSHRSFAPERRGVENLSGLAALSTAAFLAMDEDN